VHHPPTSKRVVFSLPQHPFAAAHGIVRIPFLDLGQICRIEMDLDDDDEKTR